MQKLLRIGEFAQIGHVTVRALRFYEKEGLLAPAHVDPATGYRYYELSQAERLALITNLRAANFAIADIAGILRAGADRGALAGAIDAHRRRLADERAAIESRAKLLEALSLAFADDDANDGAMRLTTIEPQLALTAKARLAALGPEVAAMFEETEAAAARHRARALQSPFLIFHEAPPRETQFSIEVCIPVTRDLAPALPAVTTAGAAHACSLVYAGDYAKTFPLADRMRGWIDRAGLKPAGPLREVYHRFGADQEDYRLPPAMIAGSRADFLTELQIPVAFD